jgi:hypothetical protein
MAANDRAAIFLGRQAFPVSFRGPLFHDLGQLNASTALILAKRARPTTKLPTLVPFAPAFLC